MRGSWFDVDKKGLAQIAERRGGKAFALYELIQNAWDESADEVRVEVVPEDGVPKVWVTVTDDNPQGFKDLSHAWTMFAASAKKGDPEKRGRFNLGEKLVLALCDAATIKTTTGTVTFDHRGRTENKRSKTDLGSEFCGLMRMTRAEMDDAIEAMSRLIPPRGVATFINGRELKSRTPIETVEVTLPTEIADEEGNLRTSRRKTTVRLYEVEPGETATLYELGIPVVELDGDGDPFHVEVMQKVPLNMERDNVTPAYLRAVRELVLGHAHARIPPYFMASACISGAIGPETPREALDAVLTSRFGDKRVSFDPSDDEANDRAVAAGYQVIHGGSLPGAAWARVKELGLVQPAGKVTPGHRQAFSPEGKVVERIPKREWVGGMAQVAGFYRQMAAEILNIVIEVEFVSDLAIKYAALYGNRTLTLNKVRLGNAFFEHGIDEAVVELGIHELAHEKVSKHTSDAFNDECCRIGAKLALSGVLKLWRAEQ